MTSLSLPDDLVLRDASGSILLVVLDGLGGLPHPESGRTELESARTPNLDRLAARSSLGMIQPVAPGITPGSGPAHLALFGYDPTQFVIGRGVLSALGVGFELAPGDVAARLNLATLDEDGLITDRRAGRPTDAEGRGAVDLLRSKIALEEPDVEFFLMHEKEHRAVVIFRGPGLSGEIDDTDPQVTGVAPLKPEARVPDAWPLARIAEGFLDRAREVLKDEPKITGVLARGFARFDGFPSLHERFALSGVAVARYPMYRGVARLVGMEVPGVPGSDNEAVELLEESFSPDSYHFIHFKGPDARGEDGDFDAKVVAIEEIDALFPRLTDLAPDVLIVTGDHSTPAAMSSHSWHPVPLLLASPWARPTGKTFSEDDCRRGDLGIFESRHLMALTLGHAGRLARFGA